MNSWTTLGPFSRPHYVLLTMLGAMMFGGSVADAQGLFQRLRMNRAAANQSRSVPTRPQYVPQQRYAPQQQYRPQQSIVPNQTQRGTNQNAVQPTPQATSPGQAISPGVMATQPQTIGPQIPMQATPQMRIVNVQPRVYQVDVRTGRRVLSRVGQPVSIAVDPITGEGFAVNPQTRQRVAINPETGTVVAPTPGMVQTIRIDPRTGQLTASTQVVAARTPSPVVSGPTPAPSPAAKSSPAVAATPKIAPSPATTPSPKVAASPKASGPQNTAAQGSGSDSGKSILVQPSTKPAEAPVATLGIEVAKSTGAIPSLTILNFKQHSQADESGLKIGDKIFSANDQRTDSIESLATAVRKLGVGQTVKLRVGRDGRLQDVNVPIVKRPSQASLGEPVFAGPANTANSAPSTTPPSELKNPAATPASQRLASPDRPQLGVEVEERPGTRGVVIVSVDPNSPANRAGMKVGDRIVAVDGRMIADTSGLVREVNTRKIGESIAVKLVRQNQLVASNVTFSAPQTASQETAATPKKSAPSSEPGPGESKSILSNVGSMLGGLMGGSKPKPKPAPATNDSSGKSILVPRSDVAPAAIDQPAGPSRVLPASAEDEMAFGDEEPVEQSVFESTITDTSPVERTLDDDPPSARQLTPPNPPTTPKKVERSVEDLEAEIERLKALLKEKE